MIIKNLTYLSFQLVTFGPNDGRLSDDVLSRSFQGSPGNLVLGRLHLKLTQRRRLLPFETIAGRDARVPIDSHPLGLILETKTPFQLKKQFLLLVAKLGLATLEPLLQSQPRLLELVSFSLEEEINLLI